LSLTDSCARTVFLVVFLIGVASAPVLPATHTADPLRIGLVEMSGASTGSLVTGVEAAIREINAEGGMAGHLLELVKLQESRPWFDGSSRVAKLALEEGLVALIGPGDGAGAHVTAQVATRLRIPLVSLSAEDSLTRAMDPWVFQGIPGDSEQAQVLLRRTLAEPHGKRAALVIPAGREGRERRASVLEACRAIGVELAPVIQVATRAGEQRIDGNLSTLGTADVLMLWLDPAPTLDLLRAWSREPLPPVVVGSMRLDDPRFLRHVPDGAVPITMPLLRRAADKTTLQAALGYDMLRAIVDAGRRFTPDPAGIRLGLSSHSTLGGRTGNFRFDHRGNRSGRFDIGILRSGLLRPVAPTDAGRE